MKKNLKNTAVLHYNVSEIKFIYIIFYVIFIILYYVKIFNFSRHWHDGLVISDVPYCKSSVYWLKKKPVWREN
ncbi:putative xyloglucan galactosyltransferase GT15 [Trichinella pseudospiralis]